MTCKKTHGILIKYTSKEEMWESQQKSLTPEQYTTLKNIITQEDLWPESVFDEQTCSLFLDGRVQFHKI